MIIWNVRSGEKDKELLGHKGDVNVVIRINYVDDIYILSGSKDKRSNY